MTRRDVVPTCAWDCLACSVGVCGRWEACGLSSDTAARGRHRGTQLVLPWLNRAKYIVITLYSDITCSDRGIGVCRSAFVLGRLC